MLPWAARCKTACRPSGLAARHKQARDFCLDPTIRIVEPHHQSRDGGDFLSLGELLGGPPPQSRVRKARGTPERRGQS